jgi:hypothetical protein
MARLDFVCPVCGFELRDRVAPAGTPPPVCAHEQRLTFHGAEVLAQATEPPAAMEILWSSSAAVDAIHPFEYEHDDGTTETIRTIHRAREIEREAEDATAGGFGRPVVFRHLSQDRSNLDRNVFQDRHPQVAREKLLQKRRGKPIISARSLGLDVRRFTIEEE